MNVCKKYIGYMIVIHIKEKNVIEPRFDEEIQLNLVLM